MGENEDTWVHGTGLLAIRTSPAQSLAGGRGIAERCPASSISSPHLELSVIGAKAPCQLKQTAVGQAQGHGFHLYTRYSLVQLS